MAINDYWQKTLAYFGMSDDGYDEYDEYAEYAEYARVPSSGGPRRRSRPHGTGSSR
jgi:hypothetical protein